MSYAIYDSTGWKGDAASTTGLAEVRAHAERTRNRALLEFLDQGHTDPEVLAKAIKVPAGPATLVSTLRNLQNLATKCQDIIILGDTLIDE